MNQSEGSPESREETGLPLSGRRILVTRAVHQAGKLSNALRELGAEPVEVPVLEIRPPVTFEPLDHALRQLHIYNWLIFTSANAVRALAERASTLGLAISPSPSAKIAAVGPATASAARDAGFQITFVPESYVAESLMEGLLGADSQASAPDSSEGGGGFNPRKLPNVSPRALAPEERSIPTVSLQFSNESRHDFSRAASTPKKEKGALAPASSFTGQKILIARAAIARDIIPDALRAAGAEVDIVEAYQNAIPESAPQLLREALAAGLDAATFTSSSSVTHLAEVAQMAGVPFPFVGVDAISIGPITSATLRKVGWDPTAEALSSTLDGLVAALGSLKR